MRTFAYSTTTVGFLEERNHPSILAIKIALEALRERAKKWRRERVRERESVRESESNGGV